MYLLRFVAGMLALSTSAWSRTDQTAINIVNKTSPAAPSETVYQDYSWCNLLDHGVLIRRRDTSTVFSRTQVFVAKP